MGFGRFYLNNKMVMMKGGSQTQNKDGQFAIVEAEVIVGV